MAKGSRWELVVAYVTYGALGLASSIVNIPYGSLASAMTQVPTERAKLASFQMIGTAATGIMLRLVVLNTLNGQQAAGQAVPRLAGIPHFRNLLTEATFTKMVAETKARRAAAHAQAGQTDSETHENKKA